MFVETTKPSSVEHLPLKEWRYQSSPLSRKFTNLNSISDSQILSYFELRTHFFPKMQSLKVIKIEDCKISKMKKWQNMKITEIIT